MQGNTAFYQLRLLHGEMSDRRILKNAGQAQRGARTALP